MANIRTCNKHNMIACVEKTEHNADFHQIVDYLTGCSINYSLLVDPDLIGPWLQQFWATASLSSINEVPHIRAMVAGKRVLISEETIRADLLFDDGPQWKYLVHVLLHCLSPKSTSWEQFGTNIASALVGLATNQKFNFSLMIMNGMLGHISNGAASSPKECQVPDLSAAQASISQGTAEVQGTDNSQGDSCNVLRVEILKKLDLETIKVTARQSNVTPRTLEFLMMKRSSRPIRPTQEKGLKNKLVIDSPDGEYLIIHRANNHFRAFDTLWEILHILDRQDLYHLYRVVQDYYEHIPPTGLGLILLGVHTLELEDGTMIHMLAERRYPLSRELMIRMLEHGMEVEDGK
ncbi:hypothetical protein Tco_1264527 [Tanacetum coccineum]